ncbi:MAG: tetraacyldisaccharide 4'-kinase [Desulfobacteraceae bacterium]|nr:tetraacyldisaccharide 4'-kinase [Desulfobacteraceae bacterium]
MFEKWLNKLEERVRYLSNNRYTPKRFSFEMLLIGISYLYGLGVYFRLWLYKKGILKQKTLPCFVISVGNIVVGGAGKTPMAIYIAKRIKEMGKTVVVVSRGYKGEYKNESAIVSDGENILLDVKDAGDEPYMMAKIKAFPVVIGKNRFKAGMKAVETFNPDVILLDDGFQHLKLKRDLDLLLLDYATPFGNKRFLPAGRLRETPEISSKRVDAIVFTRSPENQINEKHIGGAHLNYPDCPWFITSHMPYVFKQIATTANSKKIINNVSELEGKNAVLFSGLANNASFNNTMRKLGINILDHLEFKDHYRYKESDILMINAMAKKVNADLILTTQKDWVKLGPTIKWEKEIIVIGIKIQFQDSEQFQSFLISKLNAI